MSGHLLQRELVLALRGLVLGNPGVKLGDGVVKQGPFLQEDVNLLHPLVAGSLHLVVPLLQGSNLSISLAMSGHLLCSTVGGLKDLGVSEAGLVKGGNLLVQSLDLIEVGWLGKTLGGSLLSSSQPGRVLLDSGPVLGPELDIVGVLVALNLGVSSQLGDVVGDPVELILESLSVLVNLVTLGQKSKLSCSSSLEDLELGSNIFLQIHGSGHTIFGEHCSGGFLDVLQLISGSVLPSVNSLEGVVKVDEGSAEVLNNFNSVLEAGNNLELGLNSLDLLVHNLLLVLRKSDGHAGEVVVDGLEKSTDGVVALVVELLPLLQVREGILKVVPLLDLLDLLLCNLKLRGDGLVVLSIADPSLLGVLEQLQPILCLLLGVIPTLLDPLDVALKELGFVGVLKNLLTLLNQVIDHIPLGIQLDKGLLLPLNELVNILHTGGSNVTGGGEHDAVKELNMGLQLVTVGVALPVQVDHDRGLLDAGNELLVLLDEHIQLLVLGLLLGLGPLGHQDLKNLVQPFLHLSTLKILAEGVEVIPLPLELGRGVDFVGHDTSDGLLNVLHPLGHLAVAHLIDLFDELVVFLPERHP